MNFFFVVLEGQLEKKNKFRNVFLHFAQEKGNKRIIFTSKATIQNFLFFNVIYISGKYWCDSKLEANLHINLEFMYLRIGKN